MTVEQFQCPYCSKTCTTRLEVIGHSVDMHLGKLVAAELDAKYGPDEDTLRAQQIEWNKKMARSGRRESKTRTCKIRPSFSYFIIRFWLLGLVRGAIAERL